MTVKKLTFLVLIGLMPACSGPHTPFGPIHSLKLHTKEEHDLTANTGIRTSKKTQQVIYENHKKNAQITINPGRITYHKNTPMTVSLTTDHGQAKLENLHLYYEGQDISQVLSHQAEAIDNRNNELHIKFQSIRFPPSRPNKIYISFDDSASQTHLRLAYLQPACPFLESLPVQHAQPFQKAQRYIATINQLGEQMQINPSLVAGLIAQESSFDRKAISWAKAIGLTQITPLAADEIQKTYRHWPRHPSILKMPVPLLKFQVIRGNLTSEDDFRLNPSHNIQGGIEFLKYIKAYWDAARNQRLLQPLIDIDPYIQTKLMISSYNFGPARVRLAVLESGLDWEKNQRTIGARSYHNRIQSYCHDFSLPAG